MFPWIVDFQRDIYFAFADHIKAFAGSGSWIAFLAFLPMGILFGSVHAMTPGHSKMILASYLTGSSAGLGRALVTSIALSFTHVTMSVAIVLLSLPLITMMFGGSGPGSSPVLENVSRGMLGIIGVWMIVRALSRRKHEHHKREGLMVGMTAGLIPCPLTLFVMNFAVIQHVAVVGVLFAIAMMLGIAITMSIVALVSVVFSKRLTRLMNGRPGLLEKTSRVLEVAVGLILMVVAIIQIVG